MKIDDNMKVKETLPVGVDLNILVFSLFYSTKNEALILQKIKQLFTLPSLKCIFQLFLENWNEIDINGFWVKTTIILYKWT